MSEMNVIDKVECLERTLASIRYLKDRLAKSEHQAKLLLGDNLKTDLEKALSDQILALKPVAMDIVRKQEERRIQRSREAKENNLLTIKKKALDLGLTLKPRPNINFGTDDDSNVRIIAMGVETPHGTPTLIWRRYGPDKAKGDSEFILEMKWSRLEEFGGRRILTRSVIPKEADYLPRELFKGGRLTLARLKSVEKIIAQHISGYRAFIPPFDHVVTY